MRLLTVKSPKMDPFLRTLNELPNKKELAAIEEYALSEDIIISCPAISGRFFLWPSLPFSSSSSLGQQLWMTISRESFL